MAGVSNSNLSEGHIPKKKCSAGYSLIEKKLLRASIFKKSSQHMLNLIKIYHFFNFWDVCGPQNCIWRAACLRPLFCGVKDNFEGNTSDELFGQTFSFCSNFLYPKWRLGFV
jgi:hypothetical protein